MAPRQLTAWGKPDMAVMKGACGLFVQDTQDFSKDLNPPQHSLQLNHYLAALLSFVLTDHLESRWSVGEDQGPIQAHLGHPAAAGRIKTAKAW